MSQNTLIVYDTADENRVVHVESMYKGLPTIEPLEATTWGDPIYDSTNHEYVVGVMNYDDIDFDTTTGLLTEAACTKYGVTSGEKDHYLKDVDILVPVANVRMNDMVLDTTSYELSQDVLLAADRERYLKLSVEGLQDITLDTTDLTGLPIYSLPAAEETGRIEFLIRKMDSDDSPMTDPTDNNYVWIYVTGGILYGAPNHRVQLTNGEKTFYLFAPMESREIVVTVKAEDGDSGKMVITGTYRFLVNASATG